MNATMAPPSRPRQSLAETLDIATNHGLDPNAGLILVGVRGYYRDTMGAAGRNDRGIYDDAIFVLSPAKFQSFNANTDPSRYRKGYGTAESTKGMASLKPGTWKYCLGMHRGQYLACVQAAPVTVIRDGNPDYEETGWFGINIHRGGETTTSSLGCQTIEPDQWTEFITLVRAEAKRLNQATIPYLLIEGPTR